MFSLAMRWLITAISFLVAAYFIPGITVLNFQVALFAAFVFGLINAFIRPLLLLFTLPLTIITLGLFIFVVNAISFYLVSFLTSGFKVDNFWAALLGSIVVSLTSSVLNSLFNSK
jgi:putative membrane protein